MNILLIYKNNYLIVNHIYDKKWLMLTFLGRRDLRENHFRLVVLVGLHSCMKEMYIS